MWIAKRLHVAGKRIAAAALFMVAGLVLSGPALSQDRIYDPSSGGWIAYDASKLERGAAARQGGIDGKYKRQIVSYRSGEKPGTIVVNTNDKFLYYVLANGKAIRYGVGVGRAGFAWSGETTVGRKATWPSWTPTSDMIARDPKLTKYAGGMPGGIKNPLGARALYLYEGKRDSLYRIHGTNEPWSIGRNISSGCIRMTNADVTDLYGRVSVGTRVVVKHKRGLFSSL